MGPPGIGLRKDLFPGGSVFVGSLKVLLPPIAGRSEEWHLVLGNWPIPAKVPFADACGVIPVLLCESANRHAFWSDQGSSPEADDPTLKFRTPMIATSQECVSRRCANARGRVAVSKAHPFTRKTVNVRCWDFAAFRVAALNVAVAEIVGVKYDNVRLLAGRCETGQEKEEE